MPPSSASSSTSAIARAELPPETDALMLRRVPQGLRDRLLMPAVRLRPEAFDADDGASRPAAAARI